jgi:antitoxin component YwqK of YwqJK toxin-antitoxin module
MLGKKNYVNRQKVYEFDGNKMTYFYKSGKVKAKGVFETGLMEGEWIFYRETGQLWQTGNFKNSKKHGAWIRYDKNDKPEYQATFEEDKLQRKNKQ